MVLTIARLAVPRAAVNVLNEKALVPIDGTRRKQVDGIRARITQREDLHTRISMLSAVLLFPPLFQLLVCGCSTWTIGDRKRVFKFKGGCSMDVGVIVSGTQKRQKIVPVSVPGSHKNWVLSLSLVRHCQGEGANMVSLATAVL